MFLSPTPSGKSMDKIMRKFALQVCCAASMGKFPRWLSVISAGKWWLISQDSVEIPQKQQARLYIGLKVMTYLLFLTKTRPPLFFSGTDLPLEKHGTRSKCFEPFRSGDLLPFSGWGCVHVCVGGWGGWVGVEDFS